jgi:two-component system KDP operon response regulator KdpE
MPNPSVLIVDDDVSLLRVLTAAFEARDFEVATASAGRPALEQIRLGEPDIVILDLGLPDMDGVEVCRLMRRTVRCPIIVLSADGAEDRKVVALDDGADDYVTKPFSTPELFARVRVALRHRREVASIVDETLLVIGDLRVDVDAHVAMVNEAVLELTPKEFALLVLFARNAGKVLTHRRVLDVVWGPGQGLDTLRTHVSHLRRKLAEALSEVTISSEPGVGYRLTTSQDSRKEVDLI